MRAPHPYLLVSVSVDRTVVPLHPCGRSSNDQWVARATTWGCQYAIGKKMTSKPNRNIRVRAIDSIPIFITMLCGYLFLRTTMWLYIPFDKAPRNGSYDHLMCSYVVLVSDLSGDERPKPFGTSTWPLPPSNVARWNQGRPSC